MVDRRYERLWPARAIAVVLVLAFGVAAAGPAAAGSGGPGQKGKSAGDDAPRGRPETIPGSYIVTLQPGVSSGDFATKERANGKKVDHVYTTALNGLAGEFSPGDVDRLAKDPRVKRIEPDGVVTISDTTQSPATWGLDRIDQRARPLDNSYTYAGNGAGVKAYVIDTGIRPTHSDLAGRVVAGVDEVGGVSPATNDCHGHGTHVAGTIGGTTYGVAKGVTLVAVRVLNCQGSGSYAGVIAGIDWVTADHPAGTPAVANMSLGGGYSASVNDAVERAVSDGVAFAVAAGNSSADACLSSPSSAPSALTVGATDSVDASASFSNYGSCLDLFAPGVGITSDWNTSDSATNTISGTSMATPHVAGVAALTFATAPSATAGQITQAIKNNATPGAVSNPGSGSPNLLLYSGTAPVPPPPPPPPPPAPPPNDNFANAVTLNGTTSSVNGTNVGATKEAGEPNHAGNVGGKSVWYKFTAPGSGTASLDTFGSGFDTLLGVYTGSSVSALTERASNDDLSYPLILESAVIMNVTSGVTYYVAVDGYNSASGPVTLSWDFSALSQPPPPPPPPPSPTIGINDASIIEGRSSSRNITFTVTLSHAASGTVTVAYATANGTASAGSDYQAKSGTLSFAQGTTSRTIAVRVYGDRTKEPNETFSVNLSSPTGGATIADGSGLGTILNDD